MKKILAVGLGLSMFALSLLGVGCKKNDPQFENLKGTNGAKLLLANENLDESVFTDTDFWKKMSGTQTAATAPKLVNTAAVKPLAYADASATENEAIKPMAITGEEEYTYFRDFENYSLTMDRFDGVMGEIERAALSVAENIGWLKKNVGVTDQWVDGQSLLQVKEGEESLYVKHDYESWNGFDVAHRKTRADAKNVYEIYKCANDVGGNSITEERMIFIPNEYYEHTRWSEIGELVSYVMENSDGLWKMTRMNANFIRDDAMGRDGYLSCEHFVLKDGYGLGFDYLITYEGEKVLESRISTYNILDIENENELYRVQYLPEEDSYFFDVYMSNVESGVEALRARTDKLNTSYLMDVLLTNGDVLEEVCALREIRGGRWYGWLKDLDFNGVSADNFGAALEQTENAWREKGVQFKVGTTELGELATYTEMLGEEFKDTYTWNGYKPAQTLGDLKESLHWLKSYFSQNTALYNAVKDNAQAKTSKINLSNTHFAGLTIAGDGEYADGKVSVANLTATVAENALLEKNTEYVLKLGLALKDGTGFDTTRTVALSTAIEQKLAYVGTGALTLTQSGEYALPTNISEGEYAVVAYVATADEGVRVSDMQAVGFATVADERLDAVEMDITLEKAETGTLLVQYTVKNTLEVALEAGKAYDETEIEKILLDAVLMSGYPILSEKMEATENGYRLKCLLPVSGRLVEAYVYCVLPKDE